MYAPPLYNLSRGVKRSRSDPREWNYLEEWGADAGPAKAWKLKCTAQWERVLEEAINVFGPPLLATCKPVAQIPKAFIKYEHKFCGKNFVGMRDDRMMFIVEARRVLNVPGSKLTYTFTVKMSTGMYQEEYATSLLETDMSTAGVSLEKDVSLDAWRKKWQEWAPLMQEREIEKKLAAYIRETLTDVLSPWLSFFATRFTYETD
tara:strand:+ start:173 stop:784 length:612 start_codon:yes stop_codon:yes gene_type:complete